MSELVLTRSQNVRWQLLAGASALALVASMAAVPAASADEDNHFYFEIGGSYGAQAGGSTAWFLPFAAPGGGGEGGEGGESGSQTAERIHSPSGPNGTALPIHAGPSWDFESALKVQPADTDLIFSLGVKFGRNERRGAFASFTQTTPYSYTKFYEGAATHRESHINIDFQVGKDFGLGMFGAEGTSVFSAGLRYAHFTARTNTGFYTSTKYFAGGGSTLAKRSFVGVGPMISWEASTPLSDTGDGIFTLDWGVNAAVLFGRQKASGVLLYDDGYALGTSRDRNVTVPELGGSLGFSYRLADSGLRIAFGYRVDAAFGALDAGIYQNWQVDRVQHGPFLKIGIQAN
jgi:hypothetical protein